MRRGEDMCMTKKCTDMVCRYSPGGTTQHDDTKKLRKVTIKKFAQRKRKERI